MKSSGLPRTPALLRGPTTPSGYGRRQEQINLVLDCERWEGQRDDIAIHGLGDEVFELMDVRRAASR
ncbi:hypothetical protein GCM10022379_51350 [Micromonospora maritima]